MADFPIAIGPSGSPASNVDVDDPVGSVDPVADLPVGTQNPVGETQNADVPVGTPIPVSENSNATDDPVGTENPNGETITTPPAPLP